SRVRQAALELGDLDPDEQSRVVAEFFRDCNQDSPTSAKPNRQPPTDTRADTPALPDAPEVSDVPSPFEYLQDAECSRVLELLEDENPPTIALVFSRFSPEKAAETLAGLDSARQLEVIRLLMQPRKIHPRVVREVDQALHARWRSRPNSPDAFADKGGKITEILKSADADAERRIVAGVAAGDRRLAGQLNEQLACENLEDLSDAVLMSAIELAEPQIVVLALSGSGSGLVDRVARRLPAEEAKFLRRALSHLGMVRLSDIEDARRELLRLARRVDLQRRRDQPLRTNFAELSA
ncbi:MAG: hypothetical protein N2C14_16835, partial [Planctomycetales bacterium]